VIYQHIGVTIGVVLANLLRKAVGIHTTVVRDPRAGLGQNATL
jgi:hypothetical protein